MLTVRFNTEEEFIAELRQDRQGPGIERAVVRVTTEFRTTAYFPARNVVVVATYKVAGHNTLVRLDRYVGQVVGYLTADGRQEWHESDRKVLNEARRIEEAIIAAVAGVGCEARAGLLDEVRRDR